MSIPPPLHEARIALLIDADNAPAAKIDVILAELAKIGVANIRRAYGNWKKSELRGWEEVLHDYAIRPIQQFDYSKGKNATDMGMVIDAMDLLYTDRPEAFGIVSSDSDFTPLVLHLKAKGAKVYGFGAKKTPLPFVNACSRFLYLENIGQSGSIEDAPEVMLSTPSSSSSRSGKRGRGGRSGGSGAGANGGQNAVVQQAPNAGASQEPRNAEGAPMRMDRSALKRDARLVTLLRNAVESAAGEDGWSALGSVAQQIGNQASFDPRNYGYRKLIDLIDATQLFDLDRRGTQFVLRDKRQGGSPMAGARTETPRDVARDTPRDAAREPQRNVQRDSPRDIQSGARDAARDVFLDLQREVAQEDEQGDDDRDDRDEDSDDHPIDAQGDDGTDDRDGNRADERDASQNAPQDAQRNAPRNTQQDGRRDAPRDTRRNDAPRGARRNDPPRDTRRDDNRRDDTQRDVRRNDAPRSEQRNPARNDRPAAAPQGRLVDRHPFELPADSPARQFANAFRDPPFQAWEPEFDEPAVAAPALAPQPVTTVPPAPAPEPAAASADGPVDEAPAPAARKRAPRKAASKVAKAESPVMHDEASAEAPEPVVSAEPKSPAPAKKRAARKSTRPAAKKAVRREP